ncbi:MAG: hypothetical protein JNM18_21285 [Planctomycetaceae bacterium]|nr:hypothetical protein [Planctomycetaceae bacterium]
MMPAASTITNRSKSRLASDEQLWAKAEVETVDDAEENCPVICADEIFLGSSGAKSLRVVCYANGIHGRWQRRRVS